MVKYIILLNFLIFSAYGTVFNLQPIEQQIKKSDGVFQGHYLSSKTIRLEDGKLATQMIFKMNREQGLQSDFFGMDEVIVHYPGGSLEGQTVRVDGVPKFTEGEKVVLFIKSVQNRYWGMNLGFGSFKVVNYGNEVMLMNYIHPHHPQIGQVKLQYFEQSLKKIKGSGLKTVHLPEYPSENDKEKVNRMPSSISEEGQNRAIASKTEQSDNREGDQASTNIYWLMAALGFLGGVFRLSRQKSTK